MSRRRKKHEEHVNHEAWAIPYGDLLTLLLAFFVVMYAMSSVNEGKYRVLADSLAAAFHGAPRSMKPIQVGKKTAGPGADHSTTMVNPLSVAPRNLANPVFSGSHGYARKPREAQEAHEETPQKSPQAGQPGQDETIQQAAGQNEEMQQAVTAGALAELKQMETGVEKAMAPLIDKGLVKVRRKQFWLEIEIKTDILFPSGVAHLSDSARDTLDQIADILKPYPNPIRVEGHTDNVPIRTAAYPSNWELSAARAASVVHLLSGRGLDPHRMAVIGLGQYHPIASNDTAEGRNENRRVLLVVLASPDVPGRFFQEHSGAEPAQGGDAQAAAGVDMPADAAGQVAPNAGSAKAQAGNGNAAPGANIQWADPAGPGGE